MTTSARWLVVAALALCCSALPARAQTCVGDCDGSGRPTIDELVRGVNCTLVFDPEFAADLRMSPTTTQQTLDLSFADACADLAPCRLVVSSRWTRL